MRTLLPCTTFAAVMLVATVSSADPISVGDLIKFQSSTGTIGGGAFLVDNTANGTGVDFTTFCLQMTQHIDYSSLFRVGGITDFADDAGGNDPLSTATAWIFSSFRAGLLTGYSANEIQGAIWTLEDEWTSSAGNQAVTPLDHMVFEKKFSKSRIEIDDRFIGRVVPAIASNSPLEKIPTDDLLSGFLQINGDLRQKNNQYLLELAKKSDPKMLFKGPFQQLGNSQVEARFADTRTYVYKGKEVDKQVHLGFDLAVTANVPIVSAEAGTVVHASDLGIYGNCVVVDHGLGVMSLYGHLSSIGVKVGDHVEKGSELGRSGMTGLAGGDHLHFTMLVGGQQVTPVDWWSKQWFEDRVRRKIVAAGGV